VCRDETFTLGERTLVMGIVNVTPDSFSDGAMLATAEDAVAHGARALNHTKVIGLIRDGGKVIGVRYRSSDGSISEARARAVVNATGPWSPEISGMAGVPIRLRPAKGIHIVYPHRISNFSISAESIDGRDLLGATGRRARRVQGVDVGRIADRTHVDERRRARCQGRDQRRGVVRLVAVHHAVAPGRAQCRTGTDSLDAAAVTGNLIPEQAEGGVEPRGVGRCKVVVPAGHLAGSHAVRQGPAGRLGSIGSATA